MKWYSQKGKSGEYLYQVSMVDFEDKTFVVNDFPRDAIEFFNAPYTSDQNLENAFRHEIHLPDGMFPAAWLDMKERWTTLGHKMKTTIWTDVEVGTIWQNENLGGATEPKWDWSIVQYEIVDRRTCFWQCRDHDHEDPS